MLVEPLTGLMEQLLLARVEWQETLPVTVWRHGCRQPSLHMDVRFLACPGERFLPLHPCFQRAVFLKPGRGLG
jgi:hypothetical protein